VTSLSLLDLYELDTRAVFTQFLKDLSAQCEGETFRDLSLPLLPDTLNLKNTFPAAPGFLFNKPL
jgi:hypothetical protein